MEGEGLGEGVDVWGAGGGGGGTWEGADVWGGGGGTRGGCGGVRVCEILKRMTLNER